MKKRIAEDELLEVLRRQVKTVGGPQEWANRAKVSIQYVSDVIHNRRRPGKAIYEAMGYDKCVEYEHVREGVAQ